MPEGPRQYKRQDDVKILDKSVVYQGYFRVEKYQLQFRLFEGGWSQAIDREMFERGRAVGVLPYDSRLNKVILLEQFRIGSLHDKQSPWLLEAVAGIVDNDESDESVAIREAKEEAAVEFSRLEKIYDYWVSPGGTSERMTLFVGEVDSTNAGGIHGLVEEAEDIKVHVVDLEQAYQWVQSGEINNAPAILGVQWLMLNNR